MNARSGNVSILIVEDEVLTADMIRGHLEQHGYTVVGIAISYVEATELIAQTQPDVLLLDVRLSGPGTGIDGARWGLSRPNPPVFIYLTSQLDVNNLAEAKFTFPAGYLGKPIQLASLLSTIEIALFNNLNSTAAPHKRTLSISEGNVNHRVNVAEIRVLQAEHNYVKIISESGRPVLVRSSLADFLKRLADPAFVRTHRSFVVNTAFVRRFESQVIYLDNGIKVPISRNRRTAVQALLGEQ